MFVAKHKILGSIAVTKVILTTAVILLVSLKLVWAQKLLSSESIEEFKKQAELGDQNEQYVLGLLYYYGDRGLDKDFNKAKYWFQKSADQENAKAQFKLGEISKNGEGVSTNKSEAAKWYLKAANNGEPLAQYALGYIYLQGDGVTKDEKMALTWFKRAAYQELPAAQGWCSYFYVNGVGVPQDYVEAYAWVNLSAANDSSNKGGPILRNGMISLMTKEQIAEGQKRAATLQKEIDELKQKRECKNDSNLHNSSTNRVEQKK